MRECNDPRHEARLTVTIRNVSERDILRLYALCDMAWPHDKYKAVYLEEIKQSLFECGLNTIWEDYRNNKKHRAQIEAFEAKDNPKEIA